MSKADTPVAGKEVRLPASRTAGLAANHWFKREPLAWIILGFDILLTLLFGVLTHGAFLRATSLQSLAINSSQITLLAVGAAIVLSLGEIDISLGAVVIAASASSAALLSILPDDANYLTMLTTGIVVAMITGMACTLLTALEVLYLRINSFIAGLANLGIFTGIVYVFTNGSNITGVPLRLQDDFGNALLFDLVPYPALVAVGAAIVVWFVLRHTRVGVHIIASGSSRDAAERSGISVRPLIVGSFLAVGALAGLAAFIDVTRFGTTDLAGHQTDALAAIAGAVIGGTRLSGGRVSILGAVSGALLASIIRTGLVVVGLAPFYQLIAIGIVLLVAVTIGQTRPQR
jgi:ribose transport system permease protein